MRTITRARALILGGALVSALTVGAVAASGNTGGTDKANHQKQTVSRTTPANNPANNPATTPDTKADREAETRTESERGIVLEGTGTWKGQEVTVSVYENQRHGNVLQIVVGDPDGNHAIGSGQGREAYVIDGVLNVGLDVGGDLAVVKGTVERNGTPRPASEPNVDGDLVSSTGTHVPLLVDATFSYLGTTVDLEFEKAFRYDLESVLAD